MDIHPYHYQLLRGLIRLKLKGDHRIPLTCKDREQLVEKEKLSISKSHIMKVLSEGEHAPRKLSQHVLNELMHCAMGLSWNDFLKQNPVPEEQFFALMGKKGKKKLPQAVDARIAKLKHLVLKDDEEKK
jgi:hypothetical protein